MIHQHVAGQGGEPSTERALLRLIAAHGAVKPYEDFLGQVFRIALRSSKPVANVVDTPILLPDEVLPRRRIA